jgi:hypothetical protein
MSNESSEVYEIGIEAYVYLPLVTTDLTRIPSTNIEVGKMPGRGPMNLFSHNPAYPDAGLRMVVTPNFDTFYLSARLDLTKEPMIVSAPYTGVGYLHPARNARQGPAIELASGPKRAAGSDHAPLCTEDANIGWTLDSARNQAIQVDK